MSSAPTNQGYALPLITPIVSAAAAIVRRAALAANPGSYELAKLRFVIDQKDLPCCVSSALSGAMETLDSSGPALSPLFHYYVTRYDNGGADSDGFLYLDAGFKTLANAGICREDLHSPPFTPAGAETKPSAYAYADALTRALRRRGVRQRYAPISGISRVAAVREELAQDRPVVLGFQLPVWYPDAKKFLNEKLEWLDPDSPPPSRTGHCVLVVGYNDARGVFHIQDSHGAGSFDQGCWWMGYRVVDSSVIQEGYRLIP